jgi:hypothetical protein
MTLEEAINYPFPAGSPNSPTTVGGARIEDWKWLADKHEREGKAILEAPLAAFMAVKDDIVAEVKRREEFNLAGYVVREHIRLMQEGQVK